MTHAFATSCAACGSAVTGKFCSSCGASDGGAACAGCGVEMAPTARFCAACGRPTSSATLGAAEQSSGNDRTPWLVAGVALIALLGVLLAMLTRSGATAAMAASGGGAPAGTASAEAGASGEAPPDISGMSPSERFNRLYNRVMQAAQSGDEAAVTRFTPMALMAYAQLDSVNADARYHAALLQVHTGDVKGPTALADTILKEHPAHLFGYVVRGTVARWRKDEPALARAYAGFLSHYDAETKAGRAEYEEHKSSLGDFHAAAVAAPKRRPGT